MRKNLYYGLLLGLLIVIIAFVPDAGNRLLSWLFPPRLYVLIGLIVILILYKILFELRNRNSQDDIEYPAVSDEIVSGSDFDNDDISFNDPSSGFSDDYPQTESYSRKVWSESLENFLARNENAKLIKLTGKAEDFAFYEIGNRCHIVPDEDDNERYIVLCGDDMIGRLPSSAITYARKNDCEPEDLAVIVADIDYDIEKDRDIISVYISD